MYVVWAFIVILLFLHFDLSERIAFAHYTSTASSLQKHAHYPCFTLPGFALLEVAGAVVLVPGQYGQVGALAAPGSGALLSV